MFRLYQLAEAVHRYGAKLSMEIDHGGALAFTQNPIGPSSITIPYQGRKVQVNGMDQNMIGKVIDQYASAAYRCWKAGCDMVMVHGGHGWLLSQFASAYFNKRNDVYGGSLEKRARFAIEVLQEIRKRTNNKLAIEYRISGDELTPEGMHLDEVIEFVKLIQDHIDLVHVSLGTFAGHPKYIIWTQPIYLPHEYNVHRAEMIKKAVHIPVTCVGSILDLETADKIIADGKADIVAMGRANLADPEIVNKTYRGEFNEIRPCTRCQCCNARGVNFQQIRCAVNPVAGREVDYTYTPPAVRKKKVIVIGGGPGGMEAAITAASRGHDVTLFEKDNELGGNLRYAIGPPFKTDMKKYLEWLIGKTERSVNIRYSCEATPDLIRNEKPDAVIVAAGSEPLVPDIPGIKNTNVVLAGDVDTGKATVGDNVLIAGAGLVGCETALYLAQTGKKVTLIDLLKENEIAADVNVTPRIYLLDLLHQNGVSFVLESKLVEITGKGVVVADKQSIRYEIAGDTVVIALGFRSRRNFAEKIINLAREVYEVGDCVSPRNLISAVHDAFNIAVEI